MRRRGTQSGEREMRKTTCDGRAQPLENFTLVVVQTAQLLGEHAIDFLGGDLLERTAKVRELTPNSASGKVAAQAGETLVDGGPDRRQAHQLRQALLLGCLNEVVHADAGQPHEPGVVGINIGRDAKIDDQRRTLGSVREFRQDARVEYGLMPARYSRAFLDSAAPLGEADRTNLSEPDAEVTNDALPAEE